MSQKKMSETKRIPAQGDVVRVGLFDHFAQGKSVYSPRILIVDDDETNVLLLESIILEEIGSEAQFQIFKAFSGKQALKLVPITKPDLILMDISMPEMDGIEACQKIKAMDNAELVPIIFVTALADTVTHMKAIDAGGFGFLSKPIRRDLLRSYLLRCLEMKRFMDDKVEDARRTKSMVGMLAHDLKNLVQINHGYLQVMDMKLPHDNVVRFAHRMLLSSNTEMMVLTHSIMEAERVDAAGIEPRLETFDLAKLVEERCIFMQGASMESVLRLEIVNSSESFSMLSDRWLLSRVVDNLLLNAVKFSKQREEIVISLRSEKSKAYLEVINQCESLDESQKASVFDPYVRHRHNIPGFGIGLSFCKRAMEVLKGKIGVVSPIPHKDSGVVFWLEVPRGNFSQQGMQ